MLINVTKQILSYNVNNSFEIKNTVNLNDIFGNPIEMFKKKYGIELNKNNIKLFIEYSINGIILKTTYDTENGYLKDEIDIMNIFKNPNFLPSLIHNDLTEFSCSLLNNFVFDNKFTLTAKQYIENVVNKENNRNENVKINCIHLRLEDDAVEHWAKENKLPPVQFKTIIEYMYIEKIKEHILKYEKTIVLSYDYNNRVIDFLRENNYTFFLTPKMDTFREIAAAYDMEIGRYCNNVYILVYDSSFSYTLLFRMNLNIIKAIQLQYILKKPLIS
jgi:hypothetical protein